MTASVYTVGVAGRASEALFALLAQAGIRSLVDVRHANELHSDAAFSQDRLREDCARAGIDYHWAGRQLGGSRQLTADSKHLALHDPQLRGYADYMQTATFTKSAAQLLHLAALAPTALLGRVRDPQHSELSLIADYLSLQGATVIHLIDTLPGQPHLLRPEVRRESAELIYDRVVTVPA